MNVFILTREFTQFDLNATTSDAYTRDGTDVSSGTSEFSGTLIDREEVAYVKGGARTAPLATLLGFFSTPEVPVPAMILNVSEVVGGAVTATAYASDAVGDIGYGTFTASRGGFDGSVLSCTEITDTVMVASPLDFISTQLPGGELTLDQGNFTVSGSTPPLAPRFWTQFKSSSELV